jgi:hypothetical protein
MLLYINPVIVQKRPYENAKKCTFDLKKIKVEMELKKKRTEGWSIWCIAVGFYGSFGTFHILFLIFPL